MIPKPVPRSDGSTPRMISFDARCAMRDAGGRIARGDLPPTRSFICSNCRSEIPTRELCQPRRSCKSKNAALNFPARRSRIESNGNQCPGQFGFWSLSDFCGAGGVASLWLRFGGFEFWRKSSCRSVYCGCAVGRDLNSRVRGFGPTTRGSPIVQIAADPVAKVSRRVVNVMWRLCRLHRL